VNGGSSEHRDPDVLRATDIVEASPAISPIKDRTFVRLMGNSRFRRLWIAQFVSGIGDWLVIGFLLPLVTALSGGSAFAVAGILIAKIIPALLLSSVTGVLVDRFDRRRLMIAADLVRAVLVLVLIGTNSLWVIYAVVLLMETASLFFYPARNSLIPSLVRPEDVTAANGLAYTTQQGAMLIGLTASGAILAAFDALVRSIMGADMPMVSYFAGLFAPALLGPRAGVFINSLTFLFSAAVIATIPVAVKTVRGAERFSPALIGRDVVESFRFLRGHAELRGLLITIGLAILGGGAIVPVGLVYIRSLAGGVPFADRIEWLEQLAAAPQTFVLVFLAFGMVAGALLVPRLSRVLRLQLLFAGSVGAFGLAMLGFALVERYWMSGMFAAFAGACIATVTVAGNSYVVHTTADELRGRVFTALESVVRVSLLLSMVVVAPFGDLVAGRVGRWVVEAGLEPERLAPAGPRITLVMASLLVLAAAAFAFRTLEWRACAEDEEGRDCG
jgi:dTMP kinase